MPDITVKMAMGEGAPVLEHLLDVKTVRLGGVYNVRANYDKPHGAMDAREDMVEREYLTKARKADGGSMQGLERLMMTRIRTGERVRGTWLAMATPLRTHLDLSR